MVKLSPKAEIINHFDNLINRVDIDIDQSIEKYKEDQFIGELKCFPLHHRNSVEYNGFDINYFDKNESSQTNKVIEWSESTKVIDYLNQVRQKTIDELRKAQEDSLEYLKSKSCDLNQLRDSTDVEEMKSRLFSDKFYFQVFYKPCVVGKDQYSWVFSLYTIFVDFYLSPFEIDFFKNFINGFETFNYFDSNRILDEKCVLINSMAKSFCDKLNTQQFPNHWISFHKQDLLNIKSIHCKHFVHYPCAINFNCSSSYLSKLESLDLYNGNNLDSKQVRIEGLSSLKSLKLRLTTIERNSFGNMSSLRKLSVYFKSEINNDLSTKLFEIFPNIEDLLLCGYFSNINLDKFFNLKNLSLNGLNGDKLNNFNFDVFKNICNQLEELRIFYSKINNVDMSKLLYGHYFPNLKALCIAFSHITKLEKKLFDGFPMLQSLDVFGNHRLKTIDKDAFSNMKNLRELLLVDNQNLDELDPEIFLCLSNLEELHLNENNLRHFDLKIMDYTPNLKEIYLNKNPIENKQEILDHFKESKIKITF